MEYFGFCVPKRLVGGWGCDQLVLYGRSNTTYDPLDLIHSVSRQGEISSPYYGLPWTRDRLEPALYYLVDLRPPWAHVNHNSNFSLEVVISQDLLTEVSDSGFQEHDSLYVEGHLARRKGRTVKQVGWEPQNPFPPPGSFFSPMTAGGKIEKISPKLAKFPL